MGKDSPDLRGQLHRAWFYAVYALPPQMQWDGKSKSEAPHSALQGQTPGQKAWK